MNDFLFLRLLVFVVFTVFTGVCSADNVKKSVDDRDDNGDTNDEGKDESLDIPPDSEPTNATCTRRANSLVHEIKTATSTNDFPFMAAVMSHQDEYLCSGAIVSVGMVLTTGTCALKPISYVIVNTTNDKKGPNSVILHITKSEKFPTFLGGSPGKDVAIIFTEKHNNTVATKLDVSNFTSHRNLYDMEAVGFGLNTDVGKTKELQYIGLDHRPSFDMGDTVRGYFDCVDTTVLTCFKDTGGPVLFDHELIGIVTDGQEECTKEITSNYELNKVMVEVLPSYVFRAWLQEHITKNVAQSGEDLISYPSPLPRAARRFNYALLEGTASASKAAVNFSKPLIGIMISMFITFMAL